MYQFEVAETISQHQLYTVEAETREEAEMLALMGETLQEDFVGEQEVLNRVMIGLRSIDGKDVQSSA